MNGKIAALLVSTIFFHSQASADVVRHVYNMTDKQWYFAIQPSGGGITTDCPGHWTRRDGVTECHVPPKTTFTLTYVTGGSVLEAPYGHLTLQSPNGTVRGWDYGGGWKDAIYIKHSGRTQGVNLNEPAGGDIQLFGDM